MCGIVGFSSNGQVSTSELDTLAQVLAESQIRGRHAAGIAWCTDLGIQSYVKPIPMKQLLHEFPLNRIVQPDGSICMIGHARYSTSDLRYNQPIVGDHLAIAHNGVVTQADPGQWSDLYNVTCESRNDSEILLQLHDSLTPQLLETSSISALYLHESGQIQVLVNGLRPLWQGHIGAHQVWASTYDILNRAGVTDITRVVSSPVQKRSNCHDCV